jgi:hypothetical protein
VRRSCPLLPQPRPGQLLSVVHQAVQRPLRVHLGLSPYSKAVELFVVPDVGKHRLHGCHALAVKLSVPRAVDGLPFALDVVERFVLYYLFHGATEVFLYLDEGSTFSLIPTDPRLTIIPCRKLLNDMDISSRPTFVEELQSIVYTHAYENFRSQWLLICDIDEYVDFPNGINTGLLEIPGNWHFFRLPVAEAVWGPEDEKYRAFSCTYFRTRARKGFGKFQSSLLYGYSFKYTVAGLVGHSQGKYFIRKGAPVAHLGIHEPTGEGLRGGWSNSIQSLETVFLLHFDAVSFERWKTKWLGRLNGARASNAYDYNRATGLYAQKVKEASKSDDFLLKLFRSLYEISKSQAVVLKLLNQLHRRKLW